MFAFIGFGHLSLRLRSPQRPQKRAARLSCVRLLACQSTAAAQITLTDLEQQVFTTLLDAVNQLGLGTTVRAAGGWVRDKLLGRSSDDIDIAVDNMSGEEFALRVAEHLTQSATGNTMSSVGVVKQNPDQSKHLATACFRLCGLSLDVNSLRTETYTEDSRIPVTTIGTPLEDATRRDFTVNALFYNLNTESVEDFTGSGLADLSEHVIRTPIPASETFRDDPLRMLRALRFAARLEFRLDDGILAAASDSTLQNLLQTKVSRERFGIEVDKMMKAQGTRPVAALALMRQVGLLGPVFISPETADALPHAPLPVEDLAEGVELSREVAEILLAEEPRQELRIAMYAALLSAWTERTLPEQGKKKKREPTALIPPLLRAALRIDTLSCEATQDVAAAAAALRAGRALEGPERSRHVGAQLRRAGERWPQALALSAALSGARGGAARRAFLQDRQWISDSGLVGCWDWRPLIDGKQLMAPPFSVPKGRKVGEVLEAQLQWRMESPRLTEEDCSRRVLELVESWDEL